MRSITLAGIILLMLALTLDIASATENVTSNATPTFANWDAWHEYISHQPTPGSGCFEAIYPNPFWQRTTCAASTSGHEAPSVYALAPSISISSSPPGASIYLDGSYQGKTPLNITKVSAGSRNITLKLPGYQDLSVTMNLVSGQAYSLSPQLTPITSVPIPTLTPTSTPTTKSSPGFDLIMTVAGVLIVTYLYKQRS